MVYLNSTAYRGRGTEQGERREGRGREERRGRKKKRWQGWEEEWKEGRRKGGRREKENQEVCCLLLALTDLVLMTPWSLECLGLLKETGPSGGPWVQRGLNTWIRVSVGQGTGQVLPEHTQGGCGCCLHCWVLV